MRALEHAAFVNMGVGCIMGLFTWGLHAAGIDNNDYWIVWGVTGIVLLGLNALALLP